MIAIRVDSSVSDGLGHLARMVILARQLRRSLPGADILFIVGEGTDLSRLSGFRYRMVPYGLNEGADAAAVSHILEESEVKWVVVDSYRLGKEWESAFVEDYRVVAFDDIGRSHVAHFVVDSGFRKDFGKRYAGKVPDYTRLLLGPGYRMVPEDLLDAACQSGPRDSIVVSLGGAGDLATLIPTLQGLLDKSAFHIDLVCGPHTAIPAQMPLQDTTRLTIHRNLPTLSPLWAKALLYVGALGGTFFEATFCKIPAITFAISSNQAHDVSELEAFGQYIYLPLNEVREDFSPVVLAAIQNRERLVKLLNQARITIPRNGAERIVEEIFMGKTAHGQDKGYDVDKVGISERGTLRMEKVTDRDMNAYLDARNMEANRRMMTFPDPIPRREHYVWWFSNKRESYKLVQDGKIELFIWHQLFEVENGKRYLAGGWFLAQEKVDITKIYYALQWQLHLTAKKYPGVSWIAVIKKKNRFTILLNESLGFIRTGNPDIKKAAIEIFGTSLHDFECYLLNMSSQ